MKFKIFIVISMLLGLFGSAYGCFDIFLFQNKGSMVYPKNVIAVETFGEYSYNSITVPNNDGFLADGRIFYGISDRLSVQVGFGSAEKPRDDFAFDEISTSGTFNIIKHQTNGYTLDGILACRGNLADNSVALEISAPSIFRGNKSVFVAHPVLELLQQNKFNAVVGAHAGLFRIFDNGTVLGIGAEYQSGQSGPFFSKRIVDGEAATSIFFGAMLGKNLFIQNELAKGLANSRDFGFAITLKGVFKLRK